MLIHVCTEGPGQIEGGSGNPSVFYALDARWAGHRDCVLILAFLHTETGHQVKSALLKKRKLWERVSIGFGDCITLLLEGKMMAMMTLSLGSVNRG